LGRSVWADDRERKIRLMRMDGGRVREVVRKRWRRRRGEGR
jgi:hypothetical protein